MSAVIGRQAIDLRECIRSRGVFADDRGLRGNYHYNAIASWRIDEKGEASNVYA